jgi:phenylalanyl-tRNA synthetase beta chain
MKINLSWILRYTNLDCNHFTTIEEQFNNCGIEVEKYDSFDYNSNIELGITPNRGDCLSVFGIASELCSVNNGTFYDVLSHIKYDELYSNSIENFIFSIESDDCALYSAIQIKDIDLSLIESPRPMVDRLSRSIVDMLSSADIPSKGIIYDLVDFITILTGQPIFAFDAEKIVGNKIIIGLAKEYEKFIGVDGIERVLQGSELVVRDDIGPIALAGIMESQRVAISKNTKSILFEAGIYKSGAIRKSAKIHSTKNEYSYRYERSVEPSKTLPSLKLFYTFLSKILNVNNFTSFYFKTKEDDTYISFDVNYPNDILGTDMTSDQIIEYLKRLGFHSSISENKICVKIDKRKEDIKRPIDLVEELAKVFGYGNIPDRLPSGILSSNNKKQKSRESEKATIVEKNYLTRMRRIKDIMVDKGFNECVNLSIKDPDIDIYDNKSSQNIIKNALSKNLSALRNNLSSGLLRCAALNINAGASNILLFEMGTVFTESDENMNLSFLVSEDSSNSYQNQIDINSIIENLNIITDSKITLKNPSGKFTWLYPNEQAAIIHNNNEIGWMGKIHPDILDKFDIKKDIFLLEIDIESILNYEKSNKKYEKFRRNILSKKDMSLVINKKEEWSEINNFILGIKDKSLQKWEIFDYYENNTIGSDNVSLGIRFYYMYDENYINKIHEDLMSKISRKFDAHIRK